MRSESKANVDPKAELSAEEQVERVIDVIAAQFNGDTTAYFETVTHQAIASESEEQVQDDLGLRSFLRYRR